MDRNGNLEKESILRINEAVKQDKNLKFDYIITSGWNYRKDTKLMIGDIMAQTLMDHYGIDQGRIIIDTNSRDTVGDAFFVRRRILELPIKKLIVVTSDYHVKRTDIIFKKFFEPKTKISTIGANTNSANYKTLSIYENLSIKAFLKTFTRINFLSDEAVYKRLSERHPYYNGNTYKKI
jgi:vancomycin permeability regulator SanA